VTEQVVGASSPPANPRLNDSYFDDGTNTGTGNPGWRFWNGSAWADSGGGGSSSDRHTATIIVGNSLDGDSLVNCHYLDVGNGVQLQLALNVGADVYIRPGTYNLQSGAQVPLTVAAGVRVRGAGHKKTIISTAVSGGGADDQRAFNLTNADVTLEDIGVYCPIPTGAFIGAAGAVVHVAAAGCTVQRVVVSFESGWVGIYSAAYPKINAAFGAYSVTDVRFIDCRSILTPQVGRLGGALFYGCFLSGVSRLATIRGMYIENADRGLYATASQFSVHQLELNGFHSRAAELLAASRGEIVGGRFYPSSYALTARRGVDVSASDDCVLDDLYIAGRAASDAAIVLINSDRAVVKGCRGDGNWDSGSGTYGEFLHLDASCVDCIVIANQSNGDGYTDLGTNTDLAHNH